MAILLLLSWQHSSKFSTCALSSLNTRSVPVEHFNIGSISYGFKGLQALSTMFVNHHGPLNGNGNLFIPESPKPFLTLLPEGLGELFYNLKKKVRVVSESSEISKIQESTIQAEKEAEGRKGNWGKSRGRLQSTWVGGLLNGAADEPLRGDPCSPSISFLISVLTLTTLRTLATNSICCLFARKN